MQHCAFVVTAERFREVEARLKSHGIDYIGPIAQLPGLLGIYFYDPNGIRLEFARQPGDGEAPAVIPCVTQRESEARDELATLPGVTPGWIEMRLAACQGDRSGCGSTSPRSTKRSRSMIFEDATSTFSSSSVARAQTRIL